MNKIYKIDFNKVDYDQYDSFIVLAENEDDAIRILKKEKPPITKGLSLGGKPYEFKNKAVDWAGGYKIEQIIQSGDGWVLLGSFNAG